VRKGRAFLAVASLTAEPVLVYGRNVVFPPNPVGMKLYQGHHLTELLALLIIVCLFLLGLLLHLARRKTKTTAQDDASWFYDI